MAGPDNGEVYVKKVGDETKTRTVHTESDRVAARFDGFRPRPAARSGGKRRTPAATEQDVEANTSQD